MIELEIQKQTKKKKIVLVSSQERAIATV